MPADLRVGGSLYPGDADRSAAAAGSSAREAIARAEMKRHMSTAALAAASKGGKPEVTAPLLTMPQISEVVGERKLGELDDKALEDVARTVTAARAAAESSGAEPDRSLIVARDAIWAERRQRATGSGIPGLSGTLAARAAAEGVSFGEVVKPASSTASTAPKGELAVRTVSGKGGRWDDSGISYEGHGVAELQKDDAYWSHLLRLPGENVRLVTDVSTERSEALARQLGDEPLKVSRTIVRGDLRRDGLAEPEIVNVAEYELTGVKGRFPAMYFQPLADAQAGQDERKAVQAAGHLENEADANQEREEPAPGRWRSGIAAAVHAALFQGRLG